MRKYWKVKLCFPTIWFYRIWYQNDLSFRNRVCYPSTLNLSRLLLSCFRLTNPRLPLFLSSLCEFLSPSLPPSPLSLNSSFSQHFHRFFRCQWRNRYSRCLHSHEGVYTQHLTWNRRVSLKFINTWRSSQWTKLNIIKLL